MRKPWWPLLGACLIMISLIVSGLAMSGQQDGDDEANRTTKVDQEFVTDQAEDTNRPPLMEKLTQELSLLREPLDNMSEWLQPIVSNYYSSNEPINLIQTDLDQDGVSNEWVTVLFEDIYDKQSGGLAQCNAYGVIITYSDSKFNVHHFTFPEESFGKAKVEAIEDLTGDDKPEVVWVSYNSGAHTTLSTFTVSSLLDGSLITYEGSTEIAYVSKSEIIDRKLMITGGLIGSAGAGPWQREYTDTYTIVNQTIQLIDRVFANSSTPYHHLIDGLWAEAHGHSKRALQSFTEASKMATSSYKPYAFIFGGEWVEGGVDTDQEKEFEHIVKKFSLLRKELLTKKMQGKTPEAACANAKEAAGYDDDWQTYLNAPAGYANPVWSKETVCSNIDELEQ